MKWNLPPKWIGIVAEPRWSKPYGWCDRTSRMVTVHPPAWIPAWRGLRNAFCDIIWNHEVLHAWGSPGCGSPWCLGYEGNSASRTRTRFTSTVLEYLAMPLQLLCGLRFCDRCLGWHLAINRREG